MNEFSYLNAPVCKDELTVLMNNMEYRTCIIKPFLDPYNLFFTDCTHPAQNAYCNRNSIVKWKISDKE